MNRLYERLLVGGDVLDGTGTPARRADVAINNGRIAAIGDIPPAQATECLPADGCVIAPGFIDVHAHSDTYLMIEPAARSKIYQGITTEVVGNCGASAAPLFGEARLCSDWAAQTYAGTWRTVADYRARLAEARPAVNVVHLVGHNTLRAGVLGYANRPARPDELALMARRLEQALDEGARGLSTGLIYPPGLFAPPEEIAALARVVAAHGGIYTTHMRSEGRALIEALTETLSVTRATGVRTQISHLKTSGRANWGLIEPALALLQAGLDEGLPFAADRYPYTASATDLDVVFPAWAQEGGRDAVLARLRDPAARTRLREELMRSRGEADWGAITIGSTRHPDNRAFQGLALDEVAHRLGLHPADAILHLAESDELGTGAFFFGMSEPNMRRILTLPWVMLGSDASVRAPDGPLALDYPHPRAYGAFARFLRMAIAGDPVKLAEGVRKMTDLPARQFGLRDRGRLAPGMAADVAVFEPARVADPSDYGAPHQLARGMRHVLVNGIPALRDSHLTCDRAGALL